jgi:hypothetical protein
MGRPSPWEAGGWDLGRKAACLCRERKRRMRWTRGLDCAWRHFFLFLWCHCFVRPLREPFFHPGPHDRAAVARSGGQGRPPLRGPPGGLVLDRREHGGRLMCVGIGHLFLGAVELTGEVRYLLVARTTAWPRAGKRMKSRRAAFTVAPHFAAPAHLASRPTPSFSAARSSSRQIERRLPRPVRRRHARHLAGT